MEEVVCRYKSKTSEAILWLGIGCFLLLVIGCSSRWYGSKEQFLRKVQYYQSCSCHGETVAQVKAELGEPDSVSQLGGERIQHWTYHFHDGWVSFKIINDIFINDKCDDACAGIYDLRMD